MNLPPVTRATASFERKNRLFIGAYGFEERSLGWVRLVSTGVAPLNSAIVFRYAHRKGNNRIEELQKTLKNLGCSEIREIRYDVAYPLDIEDTIEKKLSKVFHDVEEIVVDISAMTKFLILVLLSKLTPFEGKLRIVYSEAEDYAPSEEEYVKSKSEMGLIARFPSRGSETILRARCLSSIRMQGQPVTMVAFTSFNEQLVRHMLGTITPHRLIFINGHPPRQDFAWREKATQEIHAKIIDDYSADNPLDEHGSLIRTASTLDYLESVGILGEIYKKHGLYERIILAATGSKMQTVGLFVQKMAHPDVHVEYPTPDSYYVTGMSRGVRQVHEVCLEQFSRSVRGLRESSKVLNAGTSITF